MAAPMAVSSWYTLVLASSLGSTVFLFLIIGRGTIPLESFNNFFNDGKWIHKLFVLKYLWVVMSWNLSSSSSGHWAASRRMSCLSLFRTAKWPPFLSLAVRSQTSIMKGAFDAAKCDNNLRSRVAPKLSELDTNMYSTPAARRASIFPEPTRAAYKSPWPGGHHSTEGFVGQRAGFRVSMSILGTLFCTNSRFGSAARAGYFFFRKAMVSPDVANEFMSVKRTLDPKVSRMPMICFAVKSKKVSAPFTDNRDLA
mmetsp:Transcript_25555/g.82698  ORF Transcript_25555/g.82698 Transcript_25555/m.82698 type:complete len:254 (-) Transcript_25555:454-1215(-)